jgi:lysozyme family protein
MELENYRKIKDPVFENAFKKILQNDRLNKSPYLEHLTEKEKARIYYDDYWLKQKCNVINCSWLAERIFFLSVELGCETATVIIRRALRACLRAIRPEEDYSCINNTTICRIQKTDPHQLLIAIRSELDWLKKLLAFLESSTFKGIVLVWRKI